MKSIPMLENFRLLKNDMENSGWVIDGFDFNYKKSNYVVLVKLFLKNEIRPEYALLKTEIIDINNSEKSIIIPINTVKFLIDTRTLREFFGIEYSHNIGDILKQFYENFSKFIPDKISPNKSEHIKKHILLSLSKSDSEDPNKVFCFTVKRNPNGNKRTPFNDNKTRLLRPSLYSKLENDFSVSFCYSQNPQEEKNDNEILLNFFKKKIKTTANN